MPPESIAMWSFSGLVVAFAIGAVAYWICQEGKGFHEHRGRALSAWVLTTVVFGLVAFAIVVWVIPWAARPHVSCAEAVAAEVQAAKGFDPYGPVAAETVDACSFPSA